MASEIDLSKEIGKLLDEYGAEVTKSLQAIVPAVGKDAASKLRKESPRKTGRYKKGWTSTSTIIRTGASATVYGKSGTYQLAHLLEKGHVVKNGRSRVTGEVYGEAGAYPHIAPVNDWANQELPKLVERKIKSI